MKWRYAILGGTAAAAAATTVHDLVQTQHAIMRNFPVIGHARYFLETVGPELRQYIVTGNDEERPFSRDQRRWVYAARRSWRTTTSASAPTTTSSGSRATRSSSTAPSRAGAADDAARRRRRSCCRAPRCWAAARGRAHAFRPASVVNISAMSFGSLSGKADRGAQPGRGAGRLPPEHRRGRALAAPPQRRRPRLPDRHRATSAAATSTAASTWHGSRTLVAVGAGAGDRGQAHPGRQARPRRPAARRPRSAAEIAEIRGIPRARTASARRHTAFPDVDRMLDFVEPSPTETGLPVGIKSAVGDMTFWDELVDG